MADSFSFDFSEVTKLAADLGEAPKNIGPMLTGALRKSAGFVKRDARESVGDSEFWKGAASAIDYEVTASPGQVFSALEVEIGYDKDRPGGALGNLREFGAPLAKYGGKSVPLPPSNDLLNALEKNQEDFERGIRQAGVDAIKKAGL